MIDPNARVTIRTAGREDAEAIVRIYNYYVTDTFVTFEEEPVAELDMARRIAEVQAASLPWLVADVDGRVAGYAYASPWRTRSAYRFSVEVTVYLAPDRVGAGIGSRLYEPLFRTLQDRGIHAAMGGIALPNEASIAIHEKFGLRKVAHFAEVGFKFGRWIDVGYWQRTFD
jgi:L-amino acid N-acyltransferase YncA